VFASTERAERLLGFRAKVGFSEGMRAFTQARLRESRPGDHHRYSGVP
jgi:hypothetical protein